MTEKTRVLIQDVQYDRARGWWRIAQLVTSPDGASHRILHAIPACATVNHAAEYGLDPHDSRTVVDWLLHERFAAVPDDPAALSPYLRSAQEAWAAHTARTEEVRTRVEILDPDGCLNKIHQAHDPGPDEIEAARARVSAVRAHAAHLARKGAAR